MATNFPSSQDSFTNPTTSDTLATVSHSGQHADANDAIEAIELALLDGAPLHIDDANERVGIGKTNPSVLLDLEHATQANIHVNDSGGTIGGDTNARLSFLAGGGLAGQVGFLDTTDGTMTVQNSVGDIAVEIASAGNVTFDLYDGNVGIGTTSPTASLTVTSATDDAKVKIDSTGGSVGIIDATANSNDATGRWLAINPSGGNVGIGTTSPTVKLHVDSGSTAQFAAPQIYVAPSGHASSDRAAIQLDDIQLLTDIYGNGAEDFSIYSNTAGAHRLSIDSSGNVTTPYQPSFHAARNTNQTNVNNSAVDMNFTYYNIGNHFNTSTGQFNAPTAGTYLFNVGIFSTAGQSQFWFNVNGVRQQSIMLVSSNTVNNAASGVLYLNAGDAVDLIMWTNSTNVTVYPNGYHTFWKGTLLG